MSLITSKRGAGVGSLEEALGPQIRVWHSADGESAAKEAKTIQTRGVFLGRTETEITVLCGSPKSEMAIPIRSVVRLEVSRGQHTRVGQGLLLGLLAGGTLAALANEEEDDCPIFSTRECSPTSDEVAFAVGGFLGFVVGGFAGATMAVDEWVIVPVSGDPASGISHEDKLFWETF